MSDVRIAIDNLVTPWAVHPDVMSALTRVATGRLTAADLVKVDTEAAAPRRQTSGGVAVIPLKGVITPQPSLISLLFGGDGGGLQGFRANLREAVANDDIGPIVINIDSPGGSTDLIAETAAEIRAARQSKPVVAVANTLAASAAYWLGAQADEFVVTPSGNVGSIGVFAIHDDISGALEQAGIKPTYISAGEFKTEGNPDEPLTDTAKAHMQTMVDDFYALFVGDVATGRGITKAKVEADYGQGRVLTANRAKAAGMVDRVDTLEGTIARLAGGKLPAARASAGPRATVAPDSEPRLEPAETEVPTEEQARVARLLAARPLTL